LFISKGIPTCENENKTKGQLVVNRDYSNIANCQTDIPAIFQGVFGIFTVFQNVYLFIPRFLTEPLFRNTGI
jgi:hypothetical protein